MAASGHESPYTKDASYVRSQGSSGHDPVIAEVSDGFPAEPQNVAPPAPAHAGPGLGCALQSPPPNQPLAQESPARDRQADLDRQRLSQLQLSDRLPGERWRRLRQPHGCYGTFQPAEVIVPHNLFQEFLSLKKIRN
jgi:hypothetical protein